ncbi:MerR family transcriptional regulator, partial [Clostridium saccharobutylicum]|nr:MerR family transcriptional regulator [Clostridium saccharobutylicum]
MFEYAFENGHEICGEPIDNYLVDIINTSNPENYVTELIVPIK